MLFSLPCPFAHTFMFISERHQGKAGLPGGTRRDKSYHWGLGGVQEASQGIFSPYCLIKGKKDPSKSSQWGCVNYWAWSDASQRWKLIPRHLKNLGKNGQFSNSFRSELKILWFEEKVGHWGHITGWSHGVSFLLDTFSEPISWLLHCHSSSPRPLWEEAELLQTVTPHWVTGLGCSVWRGQGLHFKSGAVPAAWELPSTRGLLCAILTLSFVES